MTSADKYLGILQKLEREPAVEVAALSYWSLPMSGNNSYNSLAVQDTIGCAVRIINATGGYTRVFRMKEDAGRPFAAMPVGNDVTSGNYVMLSEGTADYYKERVPGFSLDTPLSWYGDTANVVTQCGMIGSFRSYRYGADAKWAFRRIDENVIRTELQDYEAQIVFRVKENMDSSDYRSKFLKEIAPHLDTDNMFIADVVPYTEQQYQFEVMKGDVDKVNTQTVVVVFLLVNVFLGLIGTFWFRTRRRRNEIALRLAMGSTKKQIFCLLMGEGLLLLTLVTLPAMIVCYNVGIAEFTMGHTELITTWPVKWSFLRFLLGSLGAWLLIALMVVIGIWFPARQAIKIQPAEALHEE
jgi:putative ABC transport system permease protein